MVGTVGAMVSFQEGSELLTELAGVAVDAKQVERTAEALGKEIAADERHYTEPLDTLALPQTLYLGMDGTGIPLRAEETGGPQWQATGWIGKDRRSKTLYHFSPEERPYSVPRMNWSWWRARFVFAGRGRPGEEIVAIPNRRSWGYKLSFMFPHVALPHAITFAIAVVLFVLGYQGRLLGFALGALPTK